MSRNFHHILVALAAAGLSLLLVDLLAAAQTMTAGLGLVPTGPERSTGTPVAGSDGTCTENACAERAERAVTPSAQGSLPHLTMPYFSFATLLPRQGGR